MIERVEVIRGPMSSLYGSEAMGGVINIITRKNRGEWAGTISSEYTKSLNDVSNNSRRPACLPAAHWWRICSVRK